MHISSELVDSIDHMNGYHYEFKMKNGELAREPVHDKDSHCADMVKYLAAYLKNPEELEKQNAQSQYEIPDYSEMGEYGLGTY